MKKQIIEFKEIKYNEAIVMINKLINRINEAIEILIANGETIINMSTIYELGINSKLYIDAKYKNKINEILKMFGIKKEDNYDIQKDEATRDKANSATKHLWNVSKILCFNYLNSFLVDERYIIIKDNVAIKAENSDNNLKERFTIYTNTEEQNKANVILLNICKEFKELDSINISPAKFFNIYGLYKIGNGYIIDGSILSNINKKTL